MQTDSTINKMAYVVVILVIAGLVFITINNKKPQAPEDVVVTTTGEEANNTNNMDQNTNDVPKKDDTASTPAKTEVKQVGGVKITVLSEGTGAVAKKGDTVAMNYTGTLKDGTTFDSNVDPKFNHVQAFVFTIGAGQVIKGWDVGIEGMKVGEKRTLEINPEYGYGATGAGGVIPPNATLTFEVELLAIK